MRNILDSNLKIKLIFEVHVDLTFLKYQNQTLVNVYHDNSTIVKF